MKVEVFNVRQGKWQLKEVQEVKDVILEIEKMDSIGEVTHDYRDALAKVVETIMAIKTDNYQPVRN